MSGKSKFKADPLPDSGLEISARQEPANPPEPSEEQVEPRSKKASKKRGRPKKSTSSSEANESFVNGHRNDSDDVAGLAKKEEADVFDFKSDDDDDDDNWLSQDRKLKLKLKEKLFRPRQRSSSFSASPKPASPKPKRERFFSEDFAAEASDAAAEAAEDNSEHQNNNEADDRCHFQEFPFQAKKNVSGYISILDLGREFHLNTTLFY
jgi:hypothetical protein